jgi:carboxyl-terminal processing protease
VGNHYKGDFFMKNVWKVLSYILVAFVASYLTMLLLPAMDQAGIPLPDTAQNSKLEQLKDLIEERYIGGAEEKELEDAAAHAMVMATGDRWSYYIPAEEYQFYVDQMANSYVGIAITIQQTEEEDGFLVIKVDAGGPADKAGMLPGDRIVAVDGISTVGMTPNEGSLLVRGEEGTPVTLTIRRESEEFDLTMIRHQVEVQVASGVMLPDNVGLVTIINFDSRCASETIAAVEDLLDQGAQAFIFDVRNNPGGYASQLVDVLDYLLPEGQLFRTVDYAGNETVDTSDAKHLDVPMAVLVNSESYSAAEFFAAAMMDYEAAVVVGEKTIGKGYFQMNYRLNDGSAVNLSVGEYFTPKGKNLAGVGIVPHVEVEVDEETFLAIYARTLDPMEDPQVLAALDALKK